MTPLSNQRSTLIGHTINDEPFFLLKLHVCPCTDISSSVLFHLFIFSSASLTEKQGS